MIARSSSPASLIRPAVIATSVAKLSMGRPISNRAPIVEPIGQEVLAHPFPGGTALPSQEDEPLGSERVGAVASVAVELPQHHEPAGEAQVVVDGARRVRGQCAALLAAQPSLLRRNEPPVARWEASDAATVVCSFAGGDVASDLATGGRGRQIDSRETETCC